MACFQILSDLHLEDHSAYDLFKVRPQAPHLALLGDIGHVKDDGLFLFLETQLRQFQIVFFLLGSNEPYYSDRTTARKRLTAFSEFVVQRRAYEAQQPQQEPPLSPFGQFVFLNQTRYDVSPDVTVLGCTFYSRVTPKQKKYVGFGLNDFFHIQDWTVKKHSARHEADRAWLNAQVARIAAREPHRSIVIFTHHSPSVVADAVDPLHANSVVLSGSATDMSGEECWENPQVRLWAYGHTHYNCDFTEERTGKRVVANQRGYYHALTQVFNPFFVARVGTIPG
ncbi:Ser/Thr protein phosphatase superfamily [Aspergillus affinis]|uniref:Ser/Thr protein phosphatase superfamily n=1 Tax=Aspergillus affinis TaxID=1070780 RepID=UPI0022FF26BB|nr:uncharacterized protein KD926_010539 [Aspergillus affinis]KAI9038699.1 hypothetical protein KD926_010539 [Aspergillus affinis]